MKRFEIESILIAALLVFLLLMTLLCGVLMLKLNSLERDACEYQFFVTDDSISVKDFGRHVGTVKIEGELKQLIEKDNE